MAMKNNLTKEQSDKTVEYECGGQLVKLTPNIVRNYLVSGGGSVTDQEIVMFLNLCRFQHLNPFLREAYLVKYGSEFATIVTGKDAFIKRARRNSACGGFEAGVVVLEEDGHLDNRMGTLVLDGERLVGGWAKVYIKGDEVPMQITVSFNEYAGVKKDGGLNAQWSKKPATMIRKVALVQALREAFPEDYQGMYSQEETGIDDAILSDAPIEIPAEPHAAAAPPSGQEDFFSGAEQ